jgi:hypothetical protein
MSQISRFGFYKKYHTKPLLYNYTTLKFRPLSLRNNRGSKKHTNSGTQCTWCPLIAAWCIGVIPLASLDSVLAPRDKSASITRGWPELGNLPNLPNSKIYQIRKIGLGEGETGASSPIFLSSWGAVYTCDFPYESPYDLVYDLLPKMSSKLIFDFFFLKCVNKPL